LVCQDTVEKYSAHMKSKGKGREKKNGIDKYEDKKHSSYY
jgi:hypothetical protein